MDSRPNRFATGASTPRSEAKDSELLTSDQSPNELPLASQLVHESLAFTVAFGRGPDGSEAVVFQTSLPPLTLGGHEYLEQLARWMVTAFSPAISRGRVAIVDRQEAERILHGITIARGAAVLDAGGGRGWANRYVQFLVENADAIVEALNRNLGLGDVGQDNPDAPALRSSIDAGDVARPIDELAKRHALPAPAELERGLNAVTGTAPMAILEAELRTAALELSELREALFAIGTIGDAAGALEAIEARLLVAIDGMTAERDEPAALSIEQESPAEHVANALMILRSQQFGRGALLVPDDFAALERRLELALEQLRKEGR